jgi:hypothetical protein
MSGYVLMDVHRKRSQIAIADEDGEQQRNLAPPRPHDLRHTAVALGIAAGANPRRSVSGPATRL